MTGRPPAPGDDGILGDDGSVTRPLPVGRAMMPLPDWVSGAGLSRSGREPGQSGPGGPADREARSGAGKSEETGKAGKSGKTGKALGEAGPERAAGAGPDGAVSAGPAGDGPAGAGPGEVGPAGVDRAGAGPDEALPISAEDDGSASDEATRDGAAWKTPGSSDVDGTTAGPSDERTVATGGADGHIEDDYRERARSYTLPLTVASLAVAAFLALAELTTAWILVVLPLATLALIGFHRILMRRLAPDRTRGEADAARRR